MQPVQIFAFTAPSVPDETYVRFLQAFKLSNGNIELRVRNGAGIENIVEISTDEAMTLSLALGAAKFPYPVVAERSQSRG